MKEIISNQVYDLRASAGITQEGLAEAIGVTRQTIIAIEKGNYTPSVLLALKIAKFFSAEGGSPPANRRAGASGGKKPTSVEEIFYIKYDPSIKTRGHGE
ncbi:MAG: helix-turn-helix transcriptional regulator [Candidatus Taylorbacteria bacterium]|nr:helix-turn-helix transcriptional regulator [Candidatus Taylorbacteria bacterium]